MALFLIFSEYWQSFCQAVQQTFPIRGKPLTDRKYVYQNPDKKLKFFLCSKYLDDLIDEVLALDSANSYLRKKSYNWKNSYRRFE